ncbi:MAG: hypothetical protein RMK19_05950 [Bacteroidia bacterium]|nr:hypothetical protein [Bacteroidia bacterium]MDW8015535.1 hypothetical protein [Bacteroidia bacterium]
MRAIVLVLAASFLLDCRRESILFSVEPRIEFVSITPKVVQEFGTLVILLRYRDGDGDLGGRTDGTPDLFLRDLRDSSLFPDGYDGVLRYNMPQFYEGPAQSIQGTIEITVPGVARLDGTRESETIAFEIFLQDRAGHESNRVYTDSVSILS